MTGAAPSTPTADVVIRLRPEQVGQHPDNIRDPARDLPALAASIREVGVLVPLIVVSVAAVDGRWTDAVTHVAVDGNRRQAAAAHADAELPCLVRDSVAGARETATIMAVTGLARDGLTGAEQAHAVQTMLDLGLSRPAGRRSRPHPRPAGHPHRLANGPGRRCAAARRRPRHVRARRGPAASGPRRRGTQADPRPGPGRAWHPDHRAPPHQSRRPDQARRPGRAAYLTTSYAGDTVAVHCCLDPTANGHVALYEPIPGSGGTGQAGPMTDEQKAERRDLIRRNKEMLAAQEVRLDAHPVMALACLFPVTVRVRKHWPGSSTATAATPAGWVGSYGEPTMLGRILGAEHPDQHCRDAAPPGTASCCGRGAVEHD